MDMRPLYLMLKPPPPVASRIARLRRHFGIIGSYGEERFHVTLLPLGDAGDFTASRFDVLRAALASVSFDPVPVGFDRLRSNALAPSHPLPQLRALQRLLLRHLAAAGLQIPGYDFRPHLSLAYGDSPPRDIAIPCIDWLADEVLLVKSIHGEGRHELIARQPLVARQRSFAFA